MADEKRVAYLAVGGKVENNPLTAAGTTLNSAGLAALPALAADEYLAIVLNPDGAGGIDPETVWLTDHANGASTGTIARAKETTAGGVDFPIDTDWIHGPTPYDFGYLAWTSYDPAWTAATTNPDIGNGTKTGAYWQVGKVLRFRIFIQFGSTTTDGAGDYSFGLPTGFAAAGHTVVPATILDSGTAWFAAVAVFNGAGDTAAHIVCADAAGARVVGAENQGGADNPITWATGDEIKLSGELEIQ